MADAPDGKMSSNDPKAAPIEREKADRGGFLGTGLPNWIAAVSGAVVAICGVVALVVSLDSSSTGTASSGSSNSKILSIGDIDNGGVWMRSDPDQHTVPGKSQKPSNGTTWIDNGTVVHPICAQSAGSYPVTNQVNGVAEKQTWHWWAKLPGDTWIPMATLLQTSTDGAFTLPVCG